MWQPTFWPRARRSPEPRRRGAALALLFALAGCSSSAQEGSPEPTPPFALRQGAQRFASHCAPCHGDTGLGDGGYLSVGAPAVPPDFTAEAVRPRLLRSLVATRLAATAAAGETHCPPWGNTLSPSEIAALATFVEQLALAGPSPAGDESADD